MMKMTMMKTTMMTTMRMKTMMKKKMKRRNRKKITSKLDRRKTAMKMRTMTMMTILMTMTTKMTMTTTTQGRHEVWTETSPAEEEVPHEAHDAEHGAQVEAEHVVHGPGDGPPAQVLRHSRHQLPGGPGAPLHGIHPQEGASPEDHLLRECPPRACLRSAALRPGTREGQRLAGRMALQDGRHECCQGTRTRLFWLDTFQLLRNHNRTQQRLDQNNTFLIHT